MAERRASGAVWAVAGSAALLISGAIIYLLTARPSIPNDPDGFDFSTAPKAKHAVDSAPLPAAAPKPTDGLSMLKVDEQTRAELNAAPTTAPAAKPGPAAPPAPVRPRNLLEARSQFVAATRKHEATVVNFAMKMTKESPVIRQYGKDWMSYPDLKKLNDDFMRTKDPIAFMVGLTKAPNFPTMIKKYAAAPDIQKFVIVGMTKEAPSDLIDAGMEWVRADQSVKQPVVDVAKALGMPPAMVAKLTSAMPKPDEPVKKP